MKNSKNQQIQNQLRQFLKSYRNHEGLSAQEAASKLGIEIAAYRTLEGKKPANRALTAILYLKKLASLNKASLTSFASFLERNDRTESGSNQLKRELWLWEKKLLEKFDFVGIPLREKFLKKLDSLEDKDLTNSLSCLAKIISLKEEQRKALFKLVEVFPND